MQRLEVSGAVRHMYMSLGVKGLRYSLRRDRKITMAYDAVCTKKYMHTLRSSLCLCFLMVSKKIMSLVPATFPNINKF
jgi:hypothetical protein